MSAGDGNVLAKVLELSGDQALAAFAGTTLILVMTISGDENTAG